MNFSTPQSSLHPITIVAHRGLHDEFPENSIAAFDAARAAGFGWIECDVWCSADGQPVIMHDETLDRTAEAIGAIASMNASVLGQIRLKNAKGFIRKWRVPIGLPDGPVLVEVKPPDARELTSKVVSLTHGRKWEWMLQSFDIRNLFHARAVDPSVPAAALVESTDELEKAISARFPAVHARHDLLTEDTTHRLRNAGASIGVWTVNEFEDIERVVKLRPDRIITDNPQTVRFVLSQFAVAGICEAPRPLARII